jgi:prefoldin subunit 5
MSEDHTQNLPNDDLRQIVAQLTSINTQLGDVRARLERLEARDYDTKPLWENALKEIAGTRVEMREGFTKVDAGMDKLRGELETGMRKVAKQIDVMNRSILEVQAELRFMDDRVTKLEPQPQ